MTILKDQRLKEEASVSMTVSQFRSFFHKQNCKIANVSHFSDDVMSSYEEDGDYDVIFGGNVLTFKKNKYELRILCKAIKSVQVGEIDQEYDSAYIATKKDSTVGLTLRKKLI